MKIEGMSGKALMGLLGVLIAVFSTELNDQVTNLALVDVRGGLSVDEDNASWFRSLYVTAQILGMSLGPALGLGFSLRRFALFAISLSVTTNVLFAFGGPLPILFALRFLQGLAEGFIIPLLITVALKLLTPKIRLYGLALYALTATLIPNMAASVAALWVDVVGDWRFMFFEAIPLCTIAGLLVWAGLEQEAPQTQRLAHFDWSGFLLLTVGMGCLSTVLQQGDRFDWFNSPRISIATLAAAVALPLFVLNETRVAVPLFRFDLFKKRNFAYAIICLFLFLIIGLSASQVPLNFLEQVVDYRPRQYYLVTLQIAVAQLVFLPAVAVLLDQRWADSRLVSAAGFLCILAACAIGGSLTGAWNRDEFFLMQALQAVGQPLVVMSLLLMATNALKPDEAPFASATVNTARALSEAVGVWLLALIVRLRGGLHRNRILDSLGQMRGSLGEIGQVAHGKTSTALLQGLNEAVQREVVALTTIDTFIILGGLVVFLLVVLAILPVRTLPPRLALQQSK